MSKLRRARRLVSRCLLVGLVCVGGLWLANTRNDKATSPALPHPNASNVLQYVSQIEYLPPKRETPLGDRHAAAIVEMGHSAGPLLLNILTNDAPSKHFD